MISIARLLHLSIDIIMILILSDKNMTGLLLLLFWESICATIKCEAKFAEKMEQ